MTSRAHISPCVEYNPIRLEDVDYRMICKTSGAMTLKDVRELTYRQACHRIENGVENTMTDHLQPNL